MEITQEPVRSEHVSSNQLMYQNIFSVNLLHDVMESDDIDDPKLESTTINSSDVAMSLQAEELIDSVDCQGNRNST